MARRYTSFDLVQLPRLDATSAQTLGTEVLSVAAKVKKLSEGVREAQGEVEVALLTLQKVSVRRLPVTTADPARSKAADITLDGAWSGLLDWLNGWAKMPGLPEAGIAISLRISSSPMGSSSSCSATSFNGQRAILVSC